jgi:hypothetical protein
MKELQRKVQKEAKRVLKRNARELHAQRELHRDKTLVTLSTTMIPKPPTTIRTKYALLTLTMCE